MSIFSPIIDEFLHCELNTVVVQQSVIGFAIHSVGLQRIDKLSLLDEED